MLPTHLALRITAKHSRYLDDASRSLEHRHVRRRHTAPGSLRNNDVIVCARRNLRQVGNREHLMMLRDATECIANLKADLATNPGIDFVKDKSGNRIGTSKNR